MKQIFESFKDFTINEAKKPFFVYKQRGSSEFKTKNEKELLEEFKKIIISENIRSIGIPVDWTPANNSSTIFKEELHKNTWKEKAVEALEDSINGSKKFRPIEYTISVNGDLEDLNDKVFITVYFDNRASQKFANDMHSGKYGSLD